MTVPPQSTLPSLGKLLDGDVGVGLPRATLQVFDRPEDVGEHSASRTNPPKVGLLAVPSR
jgi:hypothetical protein